jgi:hypothetical protein
MKAIPIALGILSLSSTAVFADQGDLLLVDAVAQAPANAPGGLPRPTHGQTQAQVSRHFGEPIERLAPVGDPPISRWVYGPFTVYFEYDRVITSVVHHED